MNNKSKNIYKKFLIVILVFFIISMIFLIDANATETTEDMKLADIINKITNIGGGIVSIVYWPLRVLIVGLFYALNLLLMMAAKAEGITNTAIGTSWFITPFDIFFNKFKILDVNFFDITAAGDRSLVFKLRTAISNWYIFVRNLSTMLLLLVLIYVGIRMALSTLAEDKAKYKKMLIDWVASLCLIYVLHYMIIFIIYCNNAIVDALYTAFNTAGSNGTDIEEAFTNIFQSALLGVGIKSMSSVVIFVMVTAQTIGFFLAYLNRMIKIGFLIIIAPLISVTYSIDKINDGKAQALGNWLKEFSYTILIQPFHCVMYLAFIKTAFDLIISADSEGLFTADYNQLAMGLIAFFCLWFTKDGEKAVRKIFGFSDDSNDTSFVAGMAVGLAAINKSKELGSKASSMHKKVGSYGKKYSNAFKKGLNNSESGKKLLNFSATKIDPLKDKAMAPLNKVKKASESFGKKKDELMGKNKLTNKMNEVLKNKEAMRAFGNKTMRSAVSLGAAAMVLGAGNGPGVAMRVGSEVGESYSNLKEGKGPKYDLTAEDKAERAKTEKDIQDKINSETKVTDALSSKNRKHTVDMNQRYLNRREENLAKKKELEEKIIESTPTDPTKTTDEQRETIRNAKSEIQKIDQELSTAIEGDTNGVAFELFQSGMLINKTPVDPNDKTKGFKYTMKSDEEIDQIYDSHSTNIRNLREEKKKNSPKNYREDRAAAKTSSGSDKKNLENAKKQLRATFEALVLEKKYAGKENEENLQIPRLSDEASDMIDKLVSTIISEIDTDIGSQKSYASRRDVYMDNVVSKLDLNGSDEEVKAQVKLALANYAKAKHDSEFAVDMKKRQ